MRAIDGTQKKKTRSSTPRSRTGCQTCRKRRIKCDETRPACLKCVQAGWKCDGYAASQPSPVDNPLAVTYKASTPTLGITRYSIPFQVPGSQKDRQLLHYFYVQGSQELCGFMDLDFWSRTVFQQSHQEATVRQALVALSSLHLDSTRDGPVRDGVVKNESLAQYGKALRMLQRRMKTPDGKATQTALVCAVLFHCFEATLGNREAATHHLKGGLKMLSSCNPEVVEQTDDLSGIMLEFERLDLQATLFYDQPLSRIPTPREIEEVDDDDEEEKVGHFQSLGDAHRVLVRAISCGWRLVGDNVAYRLSSAEEMPEWIQDQKRRLRSTLVRWKPAFDAFEERLSMTERAGYGHQILLVHWHVALMLLDAILPDDPHVWGAIPNLRATKMVEMIEDVLQQEPSLTSGSTHRIVSSEMGVIAPLFAVAMKCADRHISRRALDLMSSMKRREGLWEASQTASLVSKLMDLRELRYGAQGEDALAQARMQSLETVFAEELDHADSWMRMDASSTLLETVVAALWTSVNAEHDLAVQAIT